MDTREVNRALAEMGEPPLGAGDQVHDDGPSSAVFAGANQLELVEPTGHKRSDMVLMNGRRVILDMQLEDLADTVRMFLKQTDLDFLELPTIDVVGEQEATAVIYRNPQQFSRKAIELVQSMGVFWTKHVPGRKMADGNPSAAVRDVRAGAADAKKYKVLGLVK